MSVYKPKKSSFFHFDFQLGGRRFHGSTGKTTRREAEGFERSELKKAQASIVTEKSIDKTSIAQVWLRFWEEKGQHDAANETTWFRLETMQDGLSAILTEQGKPLVIGEITGDIIAMYVARRRCEKSRTGKTISPASVNRELQILRRILRRAVRLWNMEVRLPAWDELLLEEPDERIVDVQHSAEAKILEEMREDFRPAARWLVLSGLRLGSAMPLHPSSANFETNLLTVQQKSKKPGGKTHILPITTPMKVLLANEIGKLEDAVFTYVAMRTKGQPGSKSRRIAGQRYPIMPDTFYNEFKRAAAKAGYPDLHPHDLRHVAGTRTLRATGNLRAAQKHLGHSRISTTAKYAHFLEDELRAAMETAHQVPMQKDDTESRINPRTDTTKNAK